MFVEADFDDVYGRDLGEELYLRGRSWRWLKTRLFGLLVRDTPTGNLYREHDGSPAPTRSRRRKKQHTPEQVGDWLASWAA